MKRFTALLLAVIFCLTLLIPPVMSTPYDPFNPKDDDCIRGEDTIDEADPWGELQLTGGIYERTGYDNQLGWWQTTRFFIDYYLFGLKFNSPVIIVVKKTRINNEENGTSNEDQNTQNTNSRTGAQSPSGE